MIAYTVVHRQALLDLENDVTKFTAQLIRPSLVYECMNRSVLPFVQHMSLALDITRCW
jgi:hypothetical protein